MAIAGDRDEDLAVIGSLEQRPVPDDVAPSVICDILLQVVTTGVRSVAGGLTASRDEHQAKAGVLPPVTKWRHMALSLY